MISYNNGEVIQCLRQYEMFANSLNLVKDKTQREMIIKQLTKLEEKILLLTNEMYEEEYMNLANKHCGLFADEKNRINMLIELINQRLSYVEKRCNNHYELTGETINVSPVRGASELDSLEDRIAIIDKYIKNTTLQKEFEEDVNALTNKIALASEKIEINKSLNVELEATLKKKIEEAIQKLNLNDLMTNREEIEYAYTETQQSLELAGRNLEMAKTSPVNILADCQEMYNEMLKDYDKYRDLMCTIKLIDIYDKEVADYDELLNKRKTINEIVKYINNQELCDLIMETIAKQYNTIMMEGQDVNTYDDLMLEKDRKLEALKEIEVENNSERFQAVLKELIENERKRQEKILEEQRKIEEEEKQRKLEIERKRQEEILKRQRIIEEARKKEMEKRTKQMLEEQQKSVLQVNKKEKEATFETIKDSSLDKEDYIDLEEITDKYNLNMDEPEEKNEEFLFKDKTDIEKELFDEFNNTKEEKREIEEPYETPVLEPVVEKEPFNPPVEDTIPSIDREEVESDMYDDNKLPDVSLDEYMKNFDESKVKNTPEIFDEEFPTIPM